MVTETLQKNELDITRVFNASPEKVWKAWTEPESLKKWWGPKEFTAPVAKIDLRVGGKNLTCMRGPDGKDYWGTGTYLEIVPNKRLVVTDSFADEKGNIVPASHYGMSGDFPRELRIELDFEDQGGKTKMTLRHIGMPAGQDQDMARAGWNQSFDKLDAYLKSL